MWTLSNSSCGCVGPTMVGSYDRRRKVRQIARMRVHQTITNAQKQPMDLRRYRLKALGLPDGFAHSSAGRSTTRPLDDVDERGRHAAYVDESSMWERSAPNNGFWRWRGSTEVSTYLRPSCHRSSALMGEGSMVMEAECGCTHDHDSRAQLQDAGSLEGFRRRMRVSYIFPVACKPQATREGVETHISAVFER